MGPDRFGVGFRKNSGKRFPQSDRNGFQLQPQVHRLGDQRPVGADIDAQNDLMFPDQARQEADGTPTFFLSALITFHTPITLIN